MRFMCISTWEPEQRDPMFKKRMKEGRMLPEGIEMIHEWLDISGGRGAFVFESDDIKALFQWGIDWNNYAKFDCFPVVEILNDKGTEWA